MKRRRSIGSIVRGLEAQAAPEPWERPIVRCGACFLVQFGQKLCRRCREELPLPVVNVRVVERLVERVSGDGEQDGSVRVLAEGVVFGARMPTMKRLRELALREAIKRCDGSMLDAAEMLGMPKTTFYRQTKGVSNDEG